MTARVRAQDAVPRTTPRALPPPPARRRWPCPGRALIGPVLLIALGVGVGAASPATASQVQIFQTQSRNAFVAGTLEGVSVDPLGRLELADRVERLTAVSEPFVFSGAAHPEGWVLGTGNAGKVLLATRDGEVRELFAADEPEVFALWVDPDGTVFAGTSPEGKVYRIPMDGATPGQAEVVVEPGETYIWALARDPDGALLVATGTQGRLYRIDRGQTRVVYDSDDTHLRSLLVQEDGTLLVGTAGEGLVLKLTPKDAGEYAARTLYDAEKPEVVALTAGLDGTAYAGLLASEASLVDLSLRPASRPSSSSSGNGDEGEENGGDEGEGPQVASAEVSVETGTAGSRRAGFQGGRSEIVAILPAGRVESLWELQEETLFTLLWTRGRLWVGTGLEGKLYRWSDDEEMVLEKDVDERQVVALMADTPGPAFATTNAAAVYRVTGTTEREGTYTSPTLDAGQIAGFGRFSWRGEPPRGGSLTFSFRSGMSSEPDRTWSPWTDRRRGEEIQVADLPMGRYVQWRAHFQAGNGVSPVLFGAELSYLQQNLAPKIERFQVLEPGQVLVPTNFNPSNQVFEPAHPSRDGIFTTLEPGERAGGRLKPLWKKGYRTLRWEVKDPNDDHLRFHLDFRPETEIRDGAAWMPVVEDLEEEYYSFDATVLPDGVYRFRLRASDADDNSGDGRTEEQVSEPVVIDHGAPRRARVRREAGVLKVEIEDALSPLREAVVSFDAGEWRPVAAGDGLLDGRKEVLEIPLSSPGSDGSEKPAKPRLVLLRITDSAHNVVTFDLTGELP